MIRISDTAKTIVRDITALLEKWHVPLYQRQMYDELMTKAYLEGMKLQEENPAQQPYRVFEEVSYGLARQRVSEEYQAKG